MLQLHELLMLLMTIPLAITRRCLCLTRQQRQDYQHDSVIWREHI